MQARMWSLLCCAIGVGLSQTPENSEILIRDVTIVHATSTPVTEHADVLIHGSRIAAVAHGRSIRARAAATVLDGRGRYLIPGLWDMHTHTLRPERIPTWFPLFIANGVVGIRDMGSPLPPAEIQALKKGKISPAPRIYAVGKILGAGSEDLGIGASTPEEGRRAVRELQAGGSDFIKVYTLLSRDVFFAVVEEARTRHIAVVGHVPLTVPLAKAAAAGLKSFEHGYGLLEACSINESDVRRRIELAPSGAPNPAAAWGKIVQATDREYGEQARAGGYSEAKCATLAAALASYGTWQCPTLAVRQAFASLNDARFINDPRMKYIPGAMRQRWAAALTADARSAGMDAAGFADRRARLQQESRMALTLFRKGVRLLAGTDCGNPYLVPGFSIHDELALLVEAGLTPLEALASATSKPAQFLGLEKEFGIVEPGMRADLVLLNRDPLADIRNTRAIEAVILDDHLYNRLELDRMLSSVEAAAARGAEAQR